MLERDARRKYLLELGASMAIYILVLFGALSIGKPMPEGALRTALLLAPMIPVCLAIWAIARQFRRMDEFVRLRTLESLAIAAAVTAGLSEDAAVRALTIDAATIAGAANRIGSIEKGKAANLIVTDGNLFDEKTKITRVCVDGRPVALETLAAPADRGRGRGGR